MTKAQRLHRKRYMAKWRKKNKKRILQYEQDHIEDGRRRAREYARRNRKARADYSRRYAKTHRDTIRAYRAGPRYRAWAKQYYDKNWKQVKGHILKHRFGINFEDFERMLVAQRGLCAICRKPERTRNKWGTPRMNLCVDHDHQTGKVRGLLCRSCNHALGRFGDSVDFLKKAISYLRHYQNGH